MNKEKKTEKNKNSNRHKTEDFNIEEEFLDHTMFLYFHNNPSSKNKYRKIVKNIQKIKESNSYKKTMKTLLCKYYESEIKLKKSEEIKKFYHGSLNFGSSNLKRNTECNFNFSFNNHTKPILDIFFSEKNPALFFSSGWDGKIFLTNTNLSLKPFFKNYQTYNPISLENKPLKLFKGHSKGISKLYEDVSDNWKLFSFSYDNYIKEWDIEYGKILGRNKMQGCLKITCENRKEMYFINENKGKIFLNLFDKRSSIENISEIKIKVDKFIKIDENTFLMQNKRNMFLYDVRNNKTEELHFEAENIFLGNENIFIVKNTQTEILNKADLKKNT